MNVQQRLTTAMEWLTVTTMKVPLPASVAIVTVVTESYIVIPWVSKVMF